MSSGAAALSSAGCTGVSTARSVFGEASIDVGEVVHPDVIDVGRAGRVQRIAQLDDLGAERGVLIFEQARIIERVGADVAARPGDAVGVLGELGAVEAGGAGDPAGWFQGHH